VAKIKLTRSDLELGGPGVRVIAPDIFAGDPDAVYRGIRTTYDRLKELPERE
jgi:hypothetical protein